MKNPTDEELNVAFAINVCGWHLGDGEGEFTGYWYTANGTVAQLGRIPPRFTQSADLVLPWVEKHGMADITYGQGVWSIITRNNSQADCKTLARAVVIALLRAHRIEIEFT